MSVLFGMYFTREQFACKGLSCCGGTAAMAERLIAALDLLYAKLQVCGGQGGEIIRISSGFRCLTHNREISSNDDSYHCMGMAVDLEPIGIDMMKLTEAAENVSAFDNGGIGTYPKHIHLDVRRDGPARWKG